MILGEDVYVMTDKPLKLYAKDLEKTALLSREEEIALAQKVADGNSEARERMIESNLRLVIKIARDYQNIGLPLADLISEGNIGLMRAVDKYDLSFGAKFSTYAALWIKQSIKRALSDKSRTIRIPVHVIDKMKKLDRERERLAVTSELPPTEEELKEATGLSKNQLRLIEKSRLTSISLDAPGFGDDDSVAWHERVADESGCDPATHLKNRDLLNQLDPLLTCLNQREQDIIKRRFGLQTDEAETLDEVAHEYDVSRERIRQIQNAALEKMRHALRRKERPTRKRTEKELAGQVA